MNEIENARNMIDGIDREMAVLFEKRMQAVKMIAIHKKEKGLPVYDLQRERAVIEKNTSYLENGELKTFYMDFIHSVMDISKKYQNSLLEGSYQS